MTKKIVIIGSCGTRDVFRVCINTSLELKQYTARTSFASQFSGEGIKIKTSDLNSLPSKFQQESVYRDLSKGYFNSIKNTDFDYLVIDFIDERFRLLQLSSGEVFTFSNELGSTDFISSLVSKGKVVPANTDTHFELWKKGWNSFIRAAKTMGILDKVVVNKLYWAKLDEVGREVSSYTRNSNDYINTSNNYLDKIYQYCSQDIESNNFLVYEEASFLTKSDHEWGPAPFHYVDDFYYLTEQKLLDL